jgi:hypothetical protein
MKKIFTIFAFATTMLWANLSKAQLVAIPDPSFRSYLQSTFPDCMVGDSLDPSSIAINSITEITVNSKNIQNLDGIQYFPFLTKLDCSHNSLNVLDLSNNRNLAEINCSFNQLSSLGLNQNVDLNLLSCSSNNLTILDISSNSNLQFLYCERNSLTNIIVGNHPIFNILYCDFNQLTSLNTYTFGDFATLTCTNNLLTQLDLSYNRVLNFLVCTDNPLLTTICVESILKVNDNPDFTKDATAKWSEDCNATTEVSDNIEQCHKAVYTNDKMVFATSKGAFDISVFNLSGVLVDFSSAVDNITIPVAQSGLYIVKMTNASGTETKKVVIE